jgi:hypothetical protein
MWIVVAVICTGGIFTVAMAVAVLVAFELGTMRGEHAAEKALAQERKAELDAVVSSDPDKFSQLKVLVSSNARVIVYGIVRSAEDRELLKERITCRLGSRFSQEATGSVLTDNELAELRARVNFRVIDSAPRGQ